MEQDGPSSAGYQETTSWLGNEVLTLAEIWPQTPRAMIVGLNPAPTSVDVGHYYQGSSGRRQLLRLSAAGLFSEPSSGTFFEEAALRAGVGFTDLVRRPTRSEAGVSRQEIAHGRVRLIEALRERKVPLIVCVFRQPADAIVGGRSVVGFQSTRLPWGGALYRMPGPFERTARVEEHLSALTATLVSAQ